jgi:hypothetical protein
MTSARPIPSASRHYDELALQLERWDAKMAG